MAVITFLGVPMWLLALVGGSLAFAVADILCDIVISEGDTHEVGSAEDSDTEEGVEMAAISTPRRDASKALITAAKDVDPEDQERWSVTVVQPALHLESNFRLLSRGWGLGLFSIFLHGFAAAVA